MHPEQSTRARLMYAPVYRSFLSVLGLASRLVCLYSAQLQNTRSRKADTGLHAYTRHADKSLTKLFFHSAEALLAITRLLSLPLVFPGSCFNSTSPYTAEHFKFARPHPSRSLVCLLAKRRVPGFSSRLRKVLPCESLFRQCPRTGKPHLTDIGP